MLFVDGDGMITAITIANGTAVFRNRFIRTKSYVKELRTKGVAFRGAFGTNKSGFLSNFLDINFKNPSNTNVIYWGKRLLSLYEAGLPYRMEADSLRTLGEYTFRGLVKKGQGNKFTAHPKYDANTNRLIGFGVQQKNDKSCTVNIFEFDDQLNVKQQRYKLEFSCDSDCLSCA